MPENPPAFRRGECQVPFAGTLSEVIGIIKAGGKENHIIACEAEEDYIKIGLKRLYKLTGIKIDCNIEKNENTKFVNK